MTTSRPGKRASTCAGLCVLAALGVAPAVGATQGGDAVVAPLPAADLVEAKRLFAEAERAAEANDSARALELMQKSYELSRYPWLLFNLGTLYADLGDCEKALASFEGYLKGVENGKYRAQAATRIEELRPRCAADSAPPVALPQAQAQAQPVVASAGAGGPSGDPGRPEAPVAASPRQPLAVPTEQPSSSWSSRATIGVTLISAGTVAAGFAVFYGISWSNSAGELDSEIEAARAVPIQDRPSWSAKARGLVDERDAHRTRTIVFGAVSASLVGTGLALMLWPARRERTQGELTQDRRIVGLHVAPGEAFVEYTASTF